MLDHLWMGSQVYTIRQITDVKVVCRVPFIQYQINTFSVCVCSLIDDKKSIVLCMSIILEAVSILCQLVVE